MSRTIFYDPKDVRAIEFRLYQTTSEDTQNMSQSRSAVFPRHQKERSEPNNDKTNVTYENTWNSSKHKTKQKEKKKKSRKHPYIILTHLNPTFI